MHESSRDTYTDINWLHWRFVKSIRCHDNVMAVSATILDLIEPEIAIFDPPTADPQNPTIEPNTKLIGRPVPEILSFEISKMAVGGHVKFGTTGNRSNRSSIPEDPILESNTKSIGQPVPEVSFWRFQDVDREVWRSRDRRRTRMNINKKAQLSLTNATRKHAKNCPNSTWKLTSAFRFISPNSISPNFKLPIHSVARVKKIDSFGKRF